MLTNLTQEHWLSLIGLLRTQDLSVAQVLLENDGESRFVEGFHDDRTHGLVIGKEMKDGEEEEEAESQTEEQKQREE